MATVENLSVYKLSYKQAMEVHELTKGFPKEEKYSLTDQIRRSSRSVTVNLVESYRKRRYPKHFLAKVSDSDMENSETRAWLTFALDFGYLAREEYDSMIELNTQVGKLLNHTLRNPEKYIGDITKL